MGKFFLFFFKYFLEHSHHFEEGMSDKSDLIIDLTTKPNFASTTPMFVLISDEPTTLAGIQIKILKKPPVQKKRNRRSRF